MEEQRKPTLCIYRKSIICPMRVTDTAEAKSERLPTRAKAELQRTATYRRLLRALLQADKKTDKRRTITTMHVASQLPQRLANYPSSFGPSLGRVLGADAPPRTIKTGKGPWPTRNSGSPSARNLKPLIWSAILADVAIYTIVSVRRVATYTD